MKGKKILLGVTGSIAAYKIPLLVRLLIKEGADVKVVMTPAAAEFVSPLVLSTLSRNEVLTQLSDEATWANHVMLGRWADVMLIAPASCNTLAKMANGLCDNLLLSVYLSATCPVMVAPAMDEDMWHHAATQANIQRLRSFGHQLIDSEYGELASGLTGMGRMAEPEHLLESIRQMLSKPKPLQGKKALVTAGPTYENLDPVRFIGNYSTGKMGIAIAESLAEAGCEVELVLGPVSIPVQHAGIKVTPVVSAQQMFAACERLFPTCHLAVMSAAVADYTPLHVANEKIKKNDLEFSLPLSRTKDILKHLGNIKNNSQLLIGFALETKDEKQHALKKLHEKNADAIVLNSLREPGAGFAHDTNKVLLLEKNGQETDFPLKSKKELANDLTQKIIEWIS